MPCLRRFYAIMLLLGSALAARAAAPTLPRTPAPSPDGSLVAFSWQGDIWVVGSGGGEARRLTAHPAYEGNPIWSGDGRWIAFSSDRHGQDDVFIIHAEGGVPRRLTHHSATDTPCAFTRDGGRVLFTSRRALTPKRPPNLYAVSVEGGTPELFMDRLGFGASPSPSGLKIAYVRGGTDSARRHYRGSANRDIWIYDLETGQDR